MVPPFSPNSSGHSTGTMPSLEAVVAKTDAANQTATGGGEEGEEGGDVALRSKVLRMETDLTLVNQERQELEAKLSVCEGQVARKVSLNS